LFFYAVRQLTAFCPIQLHGDTRNTTLMQFDHLLIKTALMNVATVEPYAHSACCANAQTTHRTFLAGGNMEPNLYNTQKQKAATFWKSYFAKFQHQIEEHEVSETTPIPLSDSNAAVLPFPERRVTNMRRNANLRSS
jgi:hypothetical protein